MADVKVSALTELLGASLAPEADSLLVSDMSASLSKRMTPANVMRAAFHNLSSVYDFTTGSLGPWIAFTRASAAWYRDSAGVIARAVSDVPRFNYDPVALTPRGLLIEEAATNQYAYSEELNHASWTKTNCTVVADQLGTMDKMVENAGDGAKQLTRSVTLVNGSTYCVSAYVKSSGRDFFILTLSSTSVGGAGTQRHYFNLATGALGSGSGFAQEFIENMGNGIYRCSIIFTSLTSTAANHITFELAQVNGSATYTGDGVSGALLGNLSITELPAITSPILTGASGVTRAADVATVRNPAVLTDQCWIIKGRTPRKLSGSRINIAFQTDNGSDANRRLLYYNTSGNLIVATAVNNVTQCEINLGAVANDTDFAVAARFADNNFAASLNGGAVVTDVSGLNPMGMTTARIGRGSGVANYWNSTIKHVETRRVASNADLPGLSV